jgi:hypothetical protein
MEWEDGIYYAYRGDKEAKQRLYLIAGTHGNEIAGVMAMAKLLDEKWCWNNVKATIVFQDPSGYDDEGYGFVDTDGHSSCWPPLWGYRQNQEAYYFHVDENSAWGNTVNIPLRHRRMRILMDTLRPTFCLSLHETVRSETVRDIFWAGAGLLLIETWPISSEEYARILSPAGGSAGGLIGQIVRNIIAWLCPVAGIPVWKMALRAIRKNPSYRLVSKITKHYVESGGRLTGKKWMQYLGMGTRDPIIGQARLFHGPEMLAADWRTATDYAHGLYGAVGLTTETFPCAEVGLRGIDQRVDEQLKLMRSVLGILNDAEGSWEWEK